MSFDHTDNDIKRLIAASAGTAFRTVVEATVGMKFRSVHYKSCKAICDCIVANMVLNDKITLKSAEPVILYMHKIFRAFFTSVDNLYFPIEDRFEEYAKAVLGDEYAETKQEALRITNFIVYVISLDLSRRSDINKEEIILKTYSYAELASKKFSDYKTST